MLSCSALFWTCPGKVSERYIILSLAIHRPAPIQPSIAECCATFMCPCSAKNDSNCESLPSRRRTRMTDPGSLSDLRGRYGGSKLTPRFLAMAICSELSFPSRNFLRRFPTHNPIRQVSQISVVLGFACPNFRAYELRRLMPVSKSTCRVPTRPECQGLFGRAIL